MFQIHRLEQIQHNYIRVSVYGYVSHRCDLTAGGYLERNERHHGNGVSTC